jgi:hypothetical protein
MSSMTKLMPMARSMASVAALLAIVSLSVARADDAKPTAGGKGSAFKSKSFQIKESGEISIVLSFEAGKEVTVSTSGDQETNVQLHVKGLFFEAKDTSPGPKCLVKFTPVENDGKFVLTLKNTGPGANKVTLEVKVAE